MVEITLDINSRDSSFIGDILQRWCAKVGREQMGQLIRKMHDNLGKDPRKRYVPSLEKALSHVTVDENNVFKIMCT